MKSFPMFIKTTGRRVIIVGGGEAAAQKARLMLKTDANIVIAASELDDELKAHVIAGRAEHYDGPLTEAFFEGAAMVFVGTGCFAVDVSAHAIAKAARCAVNVVDQPHLCDLTTPSLVDRDPVVVAIGTEGTAPVLARQIKTRLEELLPQSLGGLAALAGHLRPAVSSKVPRDRRRAFWRWVFAAEPMRLWAKGEDSAASMLIKTTIAKGGETSDCPSMSGITVMGTAGGARDLMTLRAVQRLQEADVIFYDDKQAEELLELARRDAERVFIGAQSPAEKWPSQRMDHFVIVEAKKGRRTIRLVTRDAEVNPISWRLSELTRQSDIAVETVPSVAEQTHLSFGKGAVAAG